MLVRFLQGTLNSFFKQEFPKLISPILRNKLIDELIKLIEKILPLKDHLKLGQILWSVVSPAEDNRIGCTNIVFK